jgi:hypothetical protein
MGEADMGAARCRWEIALAVAVAPLAFGSVWPAMAAPVAPVVSAHPRVGEYAVNVDLSVQNAAPQVRPMSDGVVPDTGPGLPVDGAPTSGTNTATSDAPPCGFDEDPAVGCGLRIVGHSSILGRTNSMNLAKVGSCAYVSSTGPAQPLTALPAGLQGPTDGVAVLDVSSPQAPRFVQLLRTPGALETGETLSAVDTGARKVLVVGSYGGRSTIDELNAAIGPALDIYDVSEDCTRPVHKATVYWPDNAHNVTLNPSGTRVYGTRYAFEPKATATTALNALLGLGPMLTATGLPLTDVMVMDITNLAKPRLAAQLPLILPDGSPTECHKVEFDASETRMYCASDKLSGATRPDGREPLYSVWPSAGPTIWDVSDISSGRRNPVARFVGESAVRGQGGHHAVPMTITDAVGARHRYLMAANELAFTCDMAAYPRIWNIDDERRPSVVGELHLPAADRCSGAHYNDVDSREKTTMALVGWTDAGFRVFDVRDPAHPRPLAYFRPGSACYSVAYFDSTTGNIWFACKGGFFVAALSPSARASMGVPPRAVTEPSGMGTRDWVKVSIDPWLPVPSLVGQMTVGLVCWLPAATSRP